jgi:phospholipase/carboxylesterase
MPSDPKPSRRDFAGLIGTALAAVAFDGACGSIGRAFAGDGRIRARPQASTKTTLPAGQHALKLFGSRDGVIQIPAAAATQPVPLLLLLHGAGGAGSRMTARLGSIPVDAGVAVLAPDSRDQTWDAVRGSYDVDVDFLDRALVKVFGQVAIDPKRVAVGGFSDGATYAVSLGLINGDLFNQIVAFSPGFVVPGRPAGKPRVFISHGTRDEILPIAQCGRRIAAELRANQYDVTFREFVGGHEIPEAIQREGIATIAK